MSDLYERKPKSRCSSSDNFIIMVGGVAEFYVHSDSDDLYKKLT